MAWFIPLIPYAVAAVGAVAGGVQAKNKAKSEAALMEANALGEKRAAANEESAIRRQNAVQLGSMRAAAVETGFDANSGSLLELQQQTAGELELDALTARYRGELAALGLNTQAANTRISGRAAMGSSLLSAAGTLASGATRSYGGSLKLNPSPGGMAPGNYRSGG